MSDVLPPQIVVFTMSTNTPTSHKNRHVIITSSNLINLEESSALPLPDTFIKYKVQSAALEASLITVQPRRTQPEAAEGLLCTEERGLKHTTHGVSSEVHVQATIFIISIRLVYVFRYFRLEQMDVPFPFLGVDVQYQSRTWHCCVELYKEISEAKGLECHILEMAQ